MMFDAVIVLLTFALGFAVSRANLCTVACMRRLILERRIDGVAGLAIAASTSGIVLLTFAGLHGTSILPPLVAGPPEPMRR
jgi:hypothetical protein